MNTAAPNVVTNVIITDITVIDDEDVDDDNVSFTLSWNEPFTNFDPIVNYTVTINCTDAPCPEMYTVTTRTSDVNFVTNLSVMTTLLVTATNTIGTSDPAITIIADKLHT